MAKKFFRYITFILILVLVYIVYTNYPRLNMISGYSAKNMNSSVFVGNRSFEFTDATDNNFTPVNTAKDVIDFEEKSTEASVYGLMRRRAIYRDGLGSVLVPNLFDEKSDYLKPRRNQIVRDSIMPFPFIGSDDHKDTIFSNIKYNKLRAAVNSAFDSIKKTRAVLVIYKDHIIAEKYAEGFDKNSKILGWSMTKSITSTIYGILQKQGRLNIYDKVSLDAWKNDERSQITLNDLLHMNSGLAWEENYEKISDVTKMLFMTDDMGAVQEKKKLVGEINNSWNYSSGTSNLLSKNLRRYFDSHQAYLDFWYTDLIDKIGMHSMLIEADLSGTYVGSSYGWATPRDWAKFGLLYLHKGQWNGEQLFDETWVDYVTTPTQSSNGEYGGHFWLNAGGYYPDAPKTMFSANGYQGQRVFIIPSKEMVVVRMGLAGGDSIDFNKLLKEIIASVN